ncbi:hypothetical protein RO3G_12649 [Rhizopus delemar RA 99-880]|uniref:Tc1-like transposase DDE domain-containing protein n=1 Tax=Rhizopus delemar (strain RA 99-880 / ATCC MYA-4621 / FGSC 9543 / NRRL 43880) TaxID=246409 RepID=I1CHK8_RHIO9|nr:hypothetical protein RO3G_12649 [Rhizopus delemar RA 99-880]|eukprot:EIE87938.1 hypothetical protein RO3G_12649 [Rhizopus delemar RA 99-880]
MDRTLYKEILEDELERTIEYGTNKLRLERHQVIFQHDNDPKHTTKLFIALKYSSFERANSGQLYGNTDITGDWHFRPRWINHNIYSYSGARITIQK